jgi:hypothetical protein
VKKSIKDAPWKSFARDDEMEQIDDLEGALELMKEAISRISRHRERIRNRVCMRMRLAQASILGAGIGQK